jgi:hypothetical protein
MQINKFKTVYKNTVFKINKKANITKQKAFLNIDIFCVYENE